MSRTLIVVVLFRHQYTTDHAASALPVILNVAAPVSTFDCDSFSSPTVYDTPSMYLSIIVIFPCSPFEIVTLPLRRFDNGDLWWFF